ncbi:hypothetical protein APR41_14005 [Salegentibacter salinarum]|uniref:Beta-galactosidase trimerisation domain-containing protein n=1 Tax=Salegentibacter salinarum TaxID=447422 RepID=A0A2N0U0H8_9FLAO|nr:hypothetical protein [Salegentibacter salinarum]PKD20388.1 hypothetical protein APR41_14005 [Salegentibacter salinarum]SKB85309.1 hypothetical protein SAMN05660903_02889 [Salegentibacter salinarum]
MNNLKIYLLLSLVCVTFFSCYEKEGGKPSEDKKYENSKAKTAFQTSSEWMPEIDVRADVAIVYGVHGNPTDGEQEITFEDRVESWRERGYNTHFMTGIAWGSYQEYFLGEWDGENHLGEGQVQKNGDTIWHGHNVPYIVPTEPFIEYMKEEVIERVIDAGISSLYLEEPEFWARAGYSSAFKKAWEDYYDEEWKPQHESPENTWLSNKLKYQLYYEAVDKVSSYAKKYGKEKGMDIKVYVPTHSLVNYSSWQIVSPEASLAALPGIDGYIAQVWTGTSREPTYFNGEEKERTFENAFLEYGSMVSMTAPTNRKLFFLTDPIEDRKKSWDDYKKNYQATFVAKLLYPMVANYEVMPWPERIYTRPYSVEGSDEEVLIPEKYATQMQVMINALNHMPESENQVSGSHGIGVLMGNSLMFQRFPTHDGFEDPKFSNFYGQTLPLLKRGIPVETVHMENLSFDATLENIKVLVMSYSNMKPEGPEVHERISNWVKSGGVLVYAGRDDDPYQTVREWWNSGNYSFEKPSQHLLEELEIEKSAEENMYNVGDGVVHFITQNPKEFVLESNSDVTYLDVVKHAYEKDAFAGKLELKNNLHLKRGNYEIVAVMDESISRDNFEVEGTYIDLFDPELPVIYNKTIKPGQQALLFNINKVVEQLKPQVLASASRVYEEENNDNRYSFICKSPKNTVNSMRILLPQEPKNIQLVDSEGEDINQPESEWDENSSTQYLKFENAPDGVKVNISW